LRELTQPLLLLLVQGLGVTDDVDEENMPDFEAEIVVGFRRHRVSLAEESSSDHLLLRSRLNIGLPCALMTLLIPALFIGKSLNGTVAESIC
jgi:hypothetical protein